MSIESELNPQGQEERPIDTIVLNPDQARQLFEIRTANLNPEDLKAAEMIEEEVKKILGDIGAAALVAALEKGRKPIGVTRGNDGEDRYVTLGDYKEDGSGRMVLGGIGDVGTMTPKELTEIAKLPPLANYTQLLNGEDGGQSEHTGALNNSPEDIERARQSQEVLVKIKIIDHELSLAVDSMRRQINGFKPDELMEEIVAMRDDLNSINARLEEKRNLLNTLQELDPSSDVLEEDGEVFIYKQRNIISSQEQIGQNLITKLNNLTHPGNESILEDETTGYTDRDIEGFKTALITQLEFLQISLQQ